MIIFLIITVLTSTRCNDDSTDEYNCNGKLKDKSLDHIRHCIEGKWQIEYAVGGITGGFFKIEDQFVEFKANDSIYLTQQGIINVRDKVEWRMMTDRTDEQTYIMFFEDWRDYPYSWGVEGFLDVPLESSYAKRLVIFEDQNDGFTYYLNRITN